MLPRFFSLLLALTFAARAAEPFEIKDGDRVLFLGDTLLEREGTYGYLETRMHEQFPDRHFTVRNLAFSADTPLGWSRASFDPAAKGFERLKEQIDVVRPTVVFLGYGMAASLQEMTDRSGDPTLNPDPARYGAELMSAARFKRELGELMDAIVAQAGARGGAAGAAPGSTPVPGVGSGVPPERTSPAATASVNAPAATTAPKVRDGGTPSPAPGTGALPGPTTSPVRFVLLSPIRHEDLHTKRPGLPDPTQHNALLAQYTKAIEELAKERGARYVALYAPKPAGAAGSNMMLGTDGGQARPVFVTDNGIHLTKRGYAMYFLLSDPDAGLGWKQTTTDSEIFLKAAHEGPDGLKPLVKHTFTRTDPAKETGIGQERFEALRAAIIHKNELFFHQWRPANSTYLFGFRKHEQGQNAKEMPMFDPLIEQAEAEIDRLKKSRTTTAAAAPAPAVVNATAVPPPPAAPQPAAPLPKPDFTVADGYQIELWAENPLLYKPTQMNWDAQGRLWVASSALYPQIAPGGEATDTIIVLEDTDHDGKADKSSVFAGGLLIPTGVVPSFAATKDATSRSSCYVGQSTELLYFEDRDGDGQADSKRVVLSGFGTEDTHHIIHTLKWGPDGRLYFNQSVYIHSHLETPWGVVRLNAGGVLAWDPLTEKVEVFSKGLWNTWGHQFDQWGQSFQTDGAGSSGITWSFPGATFAPSEGSRRTLPSISPGSYPKFAGLELIYSPHFPAAWQGNAVTCDFRAHRIVRFGITDLAEDKVMVGQGDKGKAPALTPSPAPPVTPTSAPQSGYVTQEMPDLVRTSDVAFRPIDVKLGPDGALYVADWSNPVINHGEVDFRDPRRDHTHGRIWRITKKDTLPVQWGPLVGKPNVALYEKLLSANLWEKEQARRVLVARGSAPESDVSADPLVGITTGGMSIGIGSLMWAEKRKDAEAALAAEQLSRGLQHGTPDELVKSKHDSVRAAAVRLLGESVSNAQELLRLTPTATDFFDPETAREWVTKGRKAIATLAVDPQPRIRLEVLRALARTPTAESATLVLDAAVKIKGDPFLDFAAWQSINDLVRPWTAAMASGAWKIEGREPQLEYGLNAIDPALAGATLAQLLSEGKIVLNKGPWIELLGKAGGPPELAAIFESLIISYGADCCPGRNMTAERATSLSEPEALRAIAALLEAVRVRNVRPDGELSLADLATHAPVALRPGLTQLAGYWKTKDAATFLPVVATAADTKPELRLAAIEALRALGGPEAQTTLDSLCAPAQPFAIRRAALVALAAQKFPAAAPHLAPVLRDAPNENEALATWRQLLAVQGAVGALEKKFSDAAWVKELPPPVLLAAFRASREAGRKAQALTQVLTPLAGASAAKTFNPGDYRSLAERTTKDGDPALGELIYRRAASGCVTCHAIGGAGGIVGPSLTSIGASAPLDYIVESMLTPNAKVKEGYNAVTLKLKDGTDVTGIQARETAQEVILRNIAGQETAVPKASITGKTDVGSIMPAGLLEQLSDRERLNLYAFLGQLGKPGPYDASKGSVARVWRLYSGAQEPQALKQDVTGYVPPIYTNVDGRLAKDALTEALPLVGEVRKDFYATAQFQVATGGKVRLNLTGVSTAWLDGQPLAIASEPNPAPVLTPGVHTLAVKLDRTALPAILRAEAEGVNFLGN